MSSVPTLKNIASKLPSGTSLKLNKVPKLSEETKSPLSMPRSTQLSGSPPLKRQRTSSSNSPDMRRKLLGKTLEQNLEKKLESKKYDSSIASRDVFSVSLDEIDETNHVVEESKSMCYKDPSEEDEEVEKKSPTLSPSATQKTTNCNSLKPETEEVASTTVQWLQVSRTRRKARFYKIEATDDDEEGFTAVHKSSDHTKIPVGLNGKKPFMVVPGIEYGLGYEAGEDCADGLAEENDEKEIKLIKNEKYSLDSFVCDVGYLSDDELNETPSLDPVEKKVRRVRRANNIKEKKKIEMLAEPEVCGPFWWKGTRGCKKEVKKWQTILLSTLPIPTTFSSPLPSVLLEEDVATDQEVTDAAPVPVASDVKVAPAAPVVERQVEVEDYETKYHIKYLVKSLVQSRMGGQRSVVSPPGLQVCSTPMVRRPGSQPQVTVSRVSYSVEGELPLISMFTRSSYWPRSPSIRTVCWPTTPRW